MLFLTDCSSSYKVETLFCMNMQLFKIRIKGRQIIVAIFQYTLLSSIILKFFHPAYLPYPMSSSLIWRHSIRTHCRGSLPSLCSPDHCVRALPDQWQNFWDVMFNLKEWPWPHQSAQNWCIMHGTRNIYVFLEFYI